MSIEEDFESVMKTADEFRAHLEEINREFREKMKETSHRAFKSFFDSTPRVRAICWVQYTPYFNDGDECVFSLSELTFCTDDIGDDPEEFNHPSSYEGVNIHATWQLYEKYVGYSEAYDREGSNYYARLAEGLKKSLETDDGTLERCNAMYAFIHSNEDLMESMFGDHQKVYVTRDGVYTKEYDHD